MTSTYLSIEEIVQKVKENDKDIKKMITSMTKHMVGTSSYWFKERRDLKTMLKILGCPTAFVT